MACIYFPCTQTNTYRKCTLQTLFVKIFKLNNLKFVLKIAKSTAKTL